jgi:hypothetical protein
MPFRVLPFHAQWLLLLRIQAHPADEECLRWSYRACPLPASSDMLRTRKGRWSWKPTSGLEYASMCFDVMKGVLRRSSVHHFCLHESCVLPRIHTLPKGPAVYRPSANSSDFAYGLGSRNTYAACKPTRNAHACCNRKKKRVKATGPNLPARVTTHILPKEKKIQPLSRHHRQ